MTFVFRVIAASILSSAILKSSPLISTITAFAPVCNTTFALAQYVYTGMITSSPGPIPHHLRKTSIPMVHELTATVVLQPQYAEIFFSNSFVLGPVVIQPLNKAAFTSSSTFSSIRGGENGIMFRNYIF